MVERDLLRDIGFVLGTGWDHEVWVFEGLFWVHYDDQVYTYPEQINGTTATPAALFKALLEAYRAEVVESLTEYPADW